MTTKQIKNGINKGKFIVHRIERETEDVITIFLSPPNRRFAYKAGQYVAVYLDKNKNNHAKFYTISSAPSEELIALSVKKIGSFSSALHDLKAGDVAYLSGPYGWFYPGAEMNNLVFLAGGIGVTPFISIMKDYENRDIEKQVDIYYTNKTFEDIAFYKDINKMAQKNKALKVHYCITRSKSRHKSIAKYGRIDAKYIKEDLGSLADKNFYICGFINFVSDLRKQLLKCRVKERNIFTESFY